MRPHFNGDAFSKNNILNIISVEYFDFKDRVKTKNIRKYKPSHRSTTQHIIIRMYRFTERCLSFPCIF